MNFKRWWILHTTPVDVRVYHALMSREQYVLDIASKYKLGVGAIYIRLMRGGMAGFIMSVEVGQTGRRSYFLTPEADTLARELATHSPHRERWERLSSVMGTP